MKWTLYQRKGIALRFARREVSELPDRRVSLTLQCWSVLLLVEEFSYGRFAEIHLATLTVLFKNLLRCESKLKKENKIM